MIEQHTSVTSVAPVPSGASGGMAVLPVGPRAGRFLVLAGVFVCAACGLVYELELVALASYLMGDSVTQTSVVLSVMVFAMGAGSLGAKRLRRSAAAGFGAVETALALVGGCSAMALYGAFAWTGGGGGPWPGGSRWLLVTFSLAIGVLIGAEVPLLMVLIQRVRRQDPGGAVADLFAADYVGALVGGLAFPFLLLPLLGQFTGALLTGAVNALAGGALVLGLFRRDIGPRGRRWLVVANVVVLGVLAAAAVTVDDFEQAAREAVYGDGARVARHTASREIVVTGGGTPDLYVDGRLRVRGRDEPRYHRALLGPAIRGPNARVLVVGGGDGLAAREALRHRGVRRVDVLEPDGAVVDLARRDPALAALNGGVYGDPRVRVLTGDAFRRLRELRPGRTGGAGYDVVVSDLADPAMTASTKLYSQEFYGLVGRVLAPGGRLAVHVGPARGQGRSFWTVEATVRAAGLRTAPYREDGWDFVLASRGGPRLPGGVVRAVPDHRPPGLPPSTLAHPRYGG